MLETPAEPEFLKIMHHAYNFLKETASTEPSWLHSDASHENTLDKIISHSVERSVSAHEQLYVEGEMHARLYLVMSGVIGSYKLLADGRRQICSFAYPGDILGTECTERHLNNAEALSPSVVRSIASSEIDKLIMNEPGFGQTLLRITAMELAHTREQLLALGRKTAAEKLITFLLDIARRNSVPGCSEVQFDLPLRRCDIADYLGLTVETVSRNFTRLKVSGVIRLLSRNKVLIEDVTLLYAMAHGGEHTRSF